MNVQFKKGVIELCVLKVLKNNDMSSFEIMDTIAKSINISENTIYPILRRLAAEKYLLPYKVEQKIGAPRKYYSITDRGKHFLEKKDLDWKIFVDGVFDILNSEEVGK